MTWVRRVQPRDERGSMALWVAVLIGGMLVVFGGLVYDGGGAATQRSELIDAAWSLARTGAAQTRLDGDDFVIDSGAADTAISDALSRQWPNITIVSQTITADSVTVTVTATYQTAMLNAVGVDSWDLTATRTAILSETGTT